MRIAEVERTTNETSIRARIDLDGTGETSVSTGVGFFDHMLEQLGKHSCIDIELKAEGDLQVDSHHTVEDAGIVLGSAIAEALADRAGVSRYGWSIVVMEEACTQVALDLSGRPLLVYEVEVPAEAIGNYDPDLTEEFFMALSRSSGMTLHVRGLSGKNSHHIVESVFKAVAQALRSAVTVDPRNQGRVPSTKGSL
ncbi:MAG: imidazoleglycerol-phosphate dehydratase HisB [Actinomycetota bacterium]|nr:imidazoleglycerol-phosphate dehydratase HisB [Actinomycetota bacterium]